MPGPTDSLTIAEHQFEDTLLTLGMEFGAESGVLEEPFRQLDELAELDEDWYPYGNEAPSTRAITMAKAILLMVKTAYGERAGAGITPYFIAPIPDGGVQLKWRTDHAQLWLMFHPSGQRNYLFEFRRQGSRFDERSNISLRDALSLVGKTILPPT